MTLDTKDWKSYFHEPYGDGTCGVVPGVGQVVEAFVTGTIRDSNPRNRRSRARRHPAVTQVVTTSKLLRPHVGHTLPQISESRMPVSSSSSGPEWLWDMLVPLHSYHRHIKKINLNLYKIWLLDAFISTNLHISPFGITEKTRMFSSLLINTLTPLPFAQMFGDNEFECWYRTSWCWSIADKVGMG